MGPKFFWTEYLIFSLYEFEKVLISDEIKSDSRTLILKFFEGSQNWTKIKCWYKNWKIIHSLVHQLRTLFSKFFTANIIFGKSQCQNGLKIPKNEINRSGLVHKFGI